MRKISEQLDEFFNRQTDIDDDLAQRTLGDSFVRMNRNDRLMPIGMTMSGMTTRLPNSLEAHGP